MKGTVEMRGAERLAAGGGEEEAEESESATSEASSKGGIFRIRNDAKQIPHKHKYLRYKLLCKGLWLALEVRVVEALVEISIRVAKHLNGPEVASPLRMQEEVTLRDGGDRDGGGNIEEF